MRFHPKSEDKNNNKNNKNDKSSYSSSPVLTCSVPYSVHWLLVAIKLIKIESSRTFSPSVARATFQVLSCRAHPVTTVVPSAGTGHVRQCRSVEQHWSKPGVPNLLACLGHTARKGVVLGHRLNTLRHVITHTHTKYFIMF